MRFLIDANLPLRLAEWFRDRGHPCRHVLELDLGQVSDEVIWDTATEAGEIIVSKDQDFADRARRQARRGTAVLWLRTGNGATSELVKLLDPLLEQIEVRILLGDRLIEVRRTTSRNARLL